jgi:hypothetical protein
MTSPLLHSKWIEQIRFDGITIRASCESCRRRILKWKYSERVKNIRTIHMLPQQTRIDRQNVEVQIVDMTM